MSFLSFFSRSSTDPPPGESKHGARFNPDNARHQLITEMRVALRYPGHYPDEKKGFDDDTYHPESPECLTAAFKKLDSLAGMTMRDLQFAYSAADDFLVCIWNYLPGADSRCIKYIIEHQLLSVNILCEMLMECFGRSGTTSYFPQQYMAKRIAAGLPHGRSGAEPFGTYGQYHMHDENIALILPYLIQQHAQEIKDWRSELCPSYTLLYGIFDGFCDDDLRRRYIDMLLNIGCDAFAPLDAESKTMTTPWHRMVRDLAYVDLAKTLGRSLSQDALRAHANVIIRKPGEHQSRGYVAPNVLMQVFLDFRYEKREMQTTKLFELIEYLVDIGADMNYVDDDGRNIADYVRDYGDADFLADNALLRHMPEATGRAESNVEQLGINPIPYAELLETYKHAKTDAKLQRFVSEWKTLELVVGKLTFAEWNDRGPNGLAYPSVYSKATNYGFYGILVDHGLFRDSGKLGSVDN